MLRERHGVPAAQLDRGRDVLLLRSAPARAVIGPKAEVPRLTENAITPVTDQVPGPTPTQPDAAGTQPASQPRVSDPGPRTVEPQR